jgi:hypothetical protein
MACGVLGLALVALLAPLRARAASGRAPASGAAAAAAARAHAADASPGAIYLSWRAPYGSRRAAATLPGSCRDTTVSDTLFLTVEPGKDSPTFAGFSGEIEFTPAAGETLGTYWHFERDGENASGLAMQFTPGPGFDEPAIFQSVGAGGVVYDHTPERGRLRFVYAVDFKTAAPVVAGQRYTIARIVLKQRRRGLTGCGAATCVRWRVASLAYGPRDEVTVDRGGSRVLTYGPSRNPCRERLPAWKLPPGIQRPGPAPAPEQTPER